MDREMEENKERERERDYLKANGTTEGRWRISYTQRIPNRERDRENMRE